MGRRGYIAAWHAQRRTNYARDVGGADVKQEHGRPCRRRLSGSARRVVSDGAFNAWPGQRRLYVMAAREITGGHARVWSHQWQRRTRGHGEWRASLAAPTGRGTPGPSKLTAGGQSGVSRRPARHRCGTSSLAISVPKSVLFPPLFAGHIACSLRRDRVLLPLLLLLLFAGPVCALSLVCPYRAPPPSHIPPRTRPRPRSHPPATQTPPESFFAHRRTSLVHTVVVSLGSPSPHHHPPPCADLAARTAQSVGSDSAPLYTIASLRPILRLASPAPAPVRRFSHAHVQSLHCRTSSEQKTPPCPVDQRRAHT